MRAWPAAAAFVWIAAGTAAIASPAGAEAALRWAAGSAAAAAAVLVRIARLLTAGGPPAPGPPTPRLGPAAAVTIGRALLLCGLAGFLAMGPVAGPVPEALSWSPGLLYGLCVLLDAADGRIARKRNEASALGAALDTEADALGVLLAALLLVQTGRVHPLYAATGVGFYAVRLAVCLRRRRGIPVRPIAPRPQARFTAGATMAFATAALLPLFGPEALVPASLAVTAASLAGIATDWLVITGRAEETGRWRGPVLGRAEALAAALLPPAVRLALAAAALGACLAPCPAAGAAGAAGAAFLSLLGVLGLAARLAAVVLSLLAAWLAATGCAAFGPLAAAAVGLLLLGAGRPRIAQPEDRFLLKGRP